MVKFGITERGDIAFTDEWIEPIEKGEVQAAVVISKALPTMRGREFLLKNSDKIIFHATTTGLGKTLAEPNVVGYRHRLVKLNSFCKLGFPKSHVVIRVDPIFPTKYHLRRVYDLVSYAAELGFKRFRWSWLDVYRHVSLRFQKFGVNIEQKLHSARADFAAQGTTPEEYWRRSRNLLRHFYTDIVFESCAENEECVGCVSKKDFKLCGLDPKEAYGKSGQRAACQCCANKVELLHDRHQCPFKCVYCYWWD